MKPILLALGLFVGFLLVRSTLVVSAQPVATVESRAPYTAASDARSRRAALLESQEHSLALREQQVQADLDDASEQLLKVAGRMERLESSDPEEAPILGELVPVRAQLVQKKSEMAQELSRVQTERRRVQEEWTALVGVRPGR